MDHDNPISYERALANVIADPGTSYRLRQSIQEDPVLRAAAAAHDEARLLDRLKELCEDDVRGAWQAIPSSSAIIINESSRD